MVTCPACGAQNPDRAKFCLECGTAVASGAPVGRGTRKLVTVLFADVAGSTALGEQLDPEPLRALLARYFTAARRIIESHGGTTEKFIGDAVMAVFGIPTMHEDDALRAVRAALELRAAIEQLNAEMSAERGLQVEFRIGVNTGNVVAGGGLPGTETLVTGDAVNVAARLQQAAAAGEVFIGEETLRLVRERVTVERVEPIAVKGKSLPVEAYRLLATADAAPEGRLDGRPPFVGRARELERLKQAFIDTGIEQRCHLFTLLGSAGVGKSRLIAEFTSSVGSGAQVVTGRCLPYGEGITFWPVAEIVRALAGADHDAADAARAKVADAVGPQADAGYIAELVENAVGMAYETSRLQEVFWAIRRWLEAQARIKPLVCVIEDIHWAEPTLLDLLEHIADWTRDAPILLLCTARPEMLEGRPNWGGGKVNATTVLLEPLSAEATRSLVSSLIESSQLPEALIGPITATAEGNPLFAEEIAGMLAERPMDERLIADGLPMPTSIHAVIAARLDRLPAAERIVAERASVAGRVFERGAVVALVPESEPLLVAEQIRALMRKELVQPDRAELTSGEAFRFRHMLIRDAAYEALAKQERADLHERFAGWIEQVTGDRTPEFAEIVGYHYEQAHRYRHELGLDDERSAALAQHAAELLLGAARRARTRGDTLAALKQYGRAASLAGQPETRLSALLHEAGVLHELQRYGDAREPTERLATEAQAAGQEAFVWKARLLELTAAAWSDPAFDISRADAIADQAIEVFERLGDDEGLGMAFKARGDHDLARAQWARATTEYERGIVHASRSDPLLADRLRSRLRNASLWGSTPSTRVIELFEDHARGLPALEQRVGFMCSLALARAMAGMTDVAIADVEHAMQRGRDVAGNENTDAFAAGFVPYVAGDLERSDQLYGEAIGVLERLGETGERSTLVGFQAIVRFEAGRSLDEVRRLAELGRDISSPDDVASHVAYRVALALVAAAEGQADTAENLIGEAGAIASPTDFTYLKGVVARAGATIAQRAGNIDLARQRLAEAVQRFDEKEDRPDAARASAALARLG